MATSYKIQRKTATGVEDIKIDAATLDGNDSSYYLDYNNLTNKPGTVGDINVKQSSTTTGKWRKLLLGSQANESAASAVTETTDQAYVNSNLEYQASTGTLKTSTLSLTNTTATHHIKFERGGWNYISAPKSGGTIAIVAGKSNSDGSAVGALASLVVQSDNLIPGLRDNQVDLGGAYGATNYHFKDFYLKGSIKNGDNAYTLPSSSGTLALKSDLPTVNNGTLTIQKNGVNVQTFTANQSGNATANITVPTKISELTNDTGFITSDTKVTNTVNTSTKYYVTGTTSSTTNTGTQIFDTSVYVNTTAGALHATTYNIGTNATMKYDSGTQCIRFVIN